jgi:two-component system OmpR family sensor kinase
MTASLVAVPWTRSLRARLLGLLLGAIVVAALVQAAIAYRAALAEANEIFDYHMQQTALSLRYGLPLSEAEHRVRPPATERDDDFVVQVWSTEGKPVFKSVDIAALPARAPPGFSDVTLNDVHYRVFAVASPTHAIQVAQDLAVRQKMARTLAWRTIGPVLLMAPLLMAVVWWVVSGSLAPVSRVRAQVAQRQADDLSEVNDVGVPEEIQPLIQELNLLFRRLRLAFDAQRHFVADAAHELRSPLAALKLQMQALGRSGNDAARELAMSRLAAGIERATHLVEQLLVLARQQSSAAGGTPTEALDLLEVVRIELADASHAAQARTIDLGIAHADEAPIDGHREALRILVRNLLDNAVRYTPPGGTVDVELRRSDGTITLSVDDSGPGIAPHERARAFDRFYRGAEPRSTGSGLGLAIVKAIADLHGAQVSMDASRLGGLRVELRFECRAARPTTPHESH